MYKEILFILTPFLITGLTQAIKVFTRALETGRLAAKDFFAWGGFPSSHLALMGSLLTVVYFLSGWNSSAFAITLSLTILVARDASGLRMFVEQHSKAINVLRKHMPSTLQHKIPLQVESVGHTWTEIVGGTIFGIVATALFYISLQLLPSF